MGMEGGEEGEARLFRQPQALELSPSTRGKVLCRSLTLCCRRALETCGDCCRCCWGRQRAQEHVWGRFTTVFAAPRRSELSVAAVWHEAAQLPPSAARSKKSFFSQDLQQDSQHSSLRHHAPSLDSLLHPYQLQFSSSTAQEGQ